MQKKGDPMSVLAALIPSLIAGGVGAASALTSKKPKLKKIPAMNRQQLGLQNQLMDLIRGQLAPGGAYSQGQSYIQGLLSGSPESSQAFTAPYMREFNEQTIPHLAEMFSGLGAGAQSSSAFQQILGQAGAGLQEKLAQLRAGLQFQGAQSALGLPGQFLGSAFQSPFAYMQTPGGGALSSALGGLGQGIAPGLGQLSSLFALKSLFPKSFG
jgi:hypothetical protein